MAVSGVRDPAPLWGGPEKGSMELRDWPIIVDHPALGEASPQLVDCPTCGEIVTVFVDTFAGCQRYVEDCPVCCRALELTVEVRELRVTKIGATRPF